MNNILTYVSDLLQYPLAIPILVIVFFIYTSCLVSFINCMTYRIPRKLNCMTGRSRCDHCKAILGPTELIPIISCVTLTGECKHCGYHFGYSHAITEATFSTISAFMLISTTNVILSATFTLAILLIYALIMLRVEYAKSNAEL